MSGSAVYIATPKKRSGEVQPDCSDCPGVLYGNKTLLFTDEVNRIISHKFKPLPAMKGFKVSWAYGGRNISEVMGSFSVQLM